MIHELTGLFLEEVLIENKEVTMMAIVNPCHHPIDLKQGQVLGCADQVKLLEATGGYVDSCIIVLFYGNGCYNNIIASVAIETVLLLYSNL